MASDDKEKAVEFFNDMADLHGVAITSVSDGHVIMFKRDKLQEILDNNDQEKIIIFIKQPTFSN